jgi:aspartate ammonia-lyase
MRIEKDFLGEKELSNDALYGIHSLRARDNFTSCLPFHIEWYKALGIVKQACYLTAKDFKKAALNKYSQKDFATAFPTDDILDNLAKVAADIGEGKYFEHFIVPALTGGAGTSINMNINEIITNAALLSLGHKPGDYQIIDPFEHANIYQSTNDVIPTSLKLAAMLMLIDLEKAINDARAGMEEIEKSNRNNLKIAFTQMQEAVPTSYGRLFSTYSEALSRDWWRVSKCLERIKVVNLGGGAIGTGMAIPRFFIMEVVNKLQSLTRLPLTRSENLQDATSNLDSFVEVHGILKAHAVNLEKIVADLRLVASDLSGTGEISLPPRQVGSSIMPGKINPVIPEYIISIAHLVYANDVLVTSLCSQGCLDLNAYLPIIGHCFLDSIKHLISANQTLKNNLLQGMLIHSSVGYSKLIYSPSITTALLPIIGYSKSSELAKKMKEESLSIFEANDQLGLLPPDKLKQLMNPDKLLAEGYSLNDIV